MTDPIQDQLNARLHWLDDYSRSTWVPEYLKLARECAALRRLCAKAENRFDYVPPPKYEDSLRVRLRAAATGGEVTHEPS